MKPPISVAFGKAVRAYRNARDWSQMEVASHSGLHLNALSLIERGEVTPSIKTVQSLARGLGITMAELIAQAEKELKNE